MTNQNEPMNDIAHLAHVNCLLPGLTRACDFFFDVMA